MDFLEILQNFDLKLFSELVKTEHYENLIYSPCFLQLCLTIARKGTNKGPMAMEIEKVVSSTPWFLVDDELYDNFKTLLKDLNEHGEYITIANKIYMNQGLNIDESFEKWTNNYFSPIESINFNERQQMVKTINNWVESKTNNRVRNVVSPLIFDKVPLDKPMTGMVFINVIDFKAAWLYPFAEYATRDAVFYVNTSVKTKVQMMHRPPTVERFKYGKFPELKASAIELPYKDMDLSMIILLPNARFGLAALEKQVKSLSIQALKQRMNYTRIKIFLPKFKAEYEMELTETFKKLGLKRMFTNEADFQNMINYKFGDSSKVCGIYHKVCIDVNEKGNKANANAQMNMNNMGGGSEDGVPEFNANHPFYFVIQNSKGVVLIRGQVRKFQPFLVGQKTGSF